MPTVNMAVTRSPHVAGGLRIVVGAYTGPSSYVTGGDSLVAGDVGLGDIEMILFQPSSSGHQLVYDFTASKVKWLVAAGTEASGALNTITSRFIAWGK